MFYSSPELLALRAELAAKNLTTEGLTVRCNPWDLGAVWVLDPVTSRYLKVTAIDSALQGMTEYQWRVLKRTVRERFDRPEHVLNLAEGRNAIRDVVEKEAKKPSRKRRVRSTRFLQHPRGAGSEPTTVDDNSWVDVPIEESSAPATSTSSPSPPSTASEGDGVTENPPATVPLNPVDPNDLDVEDWGISSTAPR
jgi:hypothetical protein